MSLLKLPNELLLSIAATLSDSEGDISRFSRANIRLHNLLGGYLYENNIKEHLGWGMWWAAWYGQNETAKKMLEAKARIDPQDQKSLDDIFPGDLCSKDCNIEEKFSCRARKLARRVPDDFPGRSTLLSRAAWEGHEEFIKLLVDNGADINHGYENSWKPLASAAWGGHETAVNTLIEMGADIDVEESALRQTPLIFAAVRGHEAVVDLLIRKGADMECWGVGAWTPLWFAIDGNFVGIVKLLIDQGAEINPDPRNFFTPLMLAARGGYLDIVELLIEKDAAIDFPSEYGLTALYEAAARGHEKVVSFLIQQGAQVNYDGSDETPLSLAIAAGHAGVAKVLIEGGANIDFVDYRGVTPLGQAAQDGYRELVKLLIEMGANLGEIEDATSPLVSAIWGGCLDAVALLLDNGADVEGSPNEETETPLMVAAKAGREDIVEFLLKNGASINTEDLDGHTPLWWARNQKKDKVLEVMQQHCPSSIPCAAE